MSYRARETNGLAVVSLVFGILSWFALPLIGNIIAIITGHIARSQIASSGHDQDGDGLALAGLILGYIGLLLGFLIILLIIGLVMLSILVI